MPLVVAAQVATANRQPPARNIQDEMPQPRLHVEYLGLDRVAQWILEVVDFAVALAAHVDLEGVARTPDAQVGADGVKALL